jgi:TonB-linked SusC/RagA family outer membrane protein
MKKSRILIAFLLLSSVVMAQTRPLTGTVTDSKSGNGLASATISVKGENIKTVANPDGTFSLFIPTGNVSLEVTSVGYATKTILVGTKSSVSVALNQSSADMSEVVVTALGIKRERKALTYAAQTVGGDELRKAANSNFMDALSGKAAGIDIKTSNSGAGGSTKAVLRGNKSLLGLSEALYVIDGIPMVNNKLGQPGSYGGSDQGDGLSAVNPEDIESLNILRGANAAILYGSQGANGVILITTKKGKSGKATVNLGSSTIMEKVSNLPDFQYDYGAEGSSVYNWSKTKGNYQRDYIKNFFQTGINTTNSVSVSGGNDKTTAYFSYSNTSAKGVMPTNTYGKNNFSFNQSTKLLNDKLTVSSGVMFASEISKNRPGAGYYNNPLTGLYLFARQLDFSNYKNNYQVFDGDRNLYKMNWYSTEEKQNNPFWELNSDTKFAKTNRVIANVKASYDLAKHLKFEARANIDYADKVFDNRFLAGGNSVSVSANGAWSYTKYTDQSLYTDGIFNYTNTFGDVSLTAIAGASYQKNTFNDGMNVSNGGAQYNLMYPNVFTFSNMPYQVVFNQSISKTLKEGVFANVSLGYKDMLFVDLAARNDWASTLALTGNQSYLYPSVGATAIISQMVKMPEAISFFKVRASLSQTANEVPYNVVNPLNNITSAGGPAGPGNISYNSQVPFKNLKPEKITSNEYGTEMKFLKGRFGFEFTYYSDISTNQFLQLAAPSGSGYTVQYINAGKITNKGFELTLNADVVKSSEFQWKASVNFSQNKNKIVELIPSNPDYQVGGDDEGFASIIKAGGSFNDVWIYKFARNTTGQIILSDNGVPTKAAKQEKVGNVNPDFLLGWNNTVNYKNFFLSVLVNGKFGGVAFSKTEAFLDSYGVSKRSGDARASGTIPIDAVQGSAKVTSIDPVVYYSSIGDRNKIMEPYIYSRTNVRLAQFVLGYNLKIGGPNSTVKAASISLIGRNLFFFYKKAPYDPEQAMSTSNSMQSNDVFGVPATRSYGINLKVTF